MNGEEQAALALLQAELTRLRDASQAAWQAYLTWFTWFHTTQLVILGWLMTKEDLPKVPSIGVLAATLIVINVLGVIATVQQRAFSRLQGERADRICRSITASAESAGLTFEITPGFANHLIHGAFTMFTIVLSITAALWCYVLWTLPWTR